MAFDLEMFKVHLSDRQMNIPTEKCFSPWYPRGERLYYWHQNVYSEYVWSINQPIVHWVSSDLFDFLSLSDVKGTWRPSV